MGGPAVTLSSGRDRLVKLVNLLERQVLCFVNKEPDKSDTQEAAGKPDEEDLGLQIRVSVAVVYQVGRRVGQCPIEKPLVIATLANPFT